MSFPDFVIKAHLPDIKGKLVIVTAALTVIAAGIGLTAYIQNAYPLKISGFVCSVLSGVFGVWWGGLSESDLRNWIKKWDADALLTVQLCGMHFPDDLRRLAPPIDEKVFNDMIAYSGMGRRALNTYHDFWEALIFLDENPPNFDMLLRKLKDKVRMFTLTLTLAAAAIGFYSNVIYPFITSS